MGLPIPFGNPNTYAGHSGVDYPQARGAVFRASGHGYVRNLGKNLRGGYYIWVKYDGYPAVGYHHMDSHNGCPRAGTEVWEGTQLGYVGGLGQFSTGPHLHSEVEGYATTAGYWRFFDRNRVVGQGSGAGTGTGGGTPTTPGDDDMPLDANKDYAAFKEMMWRFLKYDSRDGGAEASGALGPTVFERLTQTNDRVKTTPSVGDIAKAVWAKLIQAQDKNGIGIRKPDGTPVQFTAEGFLASTNSQVNDLRTEGLVTEAQVKAIAEAVSAQIGDVAVEIDYAKVAQSVNDDAAKRMSS